MFPAQADVVFMMELRWELSFKIDGVSWKLVIIGCNKNSECQGLCVAVFILCIIAVVTK